MLSLWQQLTNYQRKRKHFRQKSKISMLRVDWFTDEWKWRDFCSLSLFRFGVGPLDYER